jgi:hypothetical protein
LATGLSWWQAGLALFGKLAQTLVRSPSATVSLKVRPERTRFTTA